MLARERRARDVFDVGLKLESIERRAAVELLPPSGVADLAAVTFAVREYFDGAQLAVDVDAGGVRNEILPADHFVDEEVAERAIRNSRAPDTQGAVSRLGARQRGDLLLLLGRQRGPHFFEALRHRKY